MNSSYRDGLLSRTSRLGLVVLLFLSFWLIPTLLTPAWAATYQVTNNNAGGAGSLLQAVTDANADPDADTIEFVAVTGTITPADVLTISEDLTITGPGAADLTVSGGGSHGVFVISNSAVVVISDLTIANGAASTTVGGGIYNVGGHLSLTEVVLSGNSTSQNAGGGLYNYSGTLILDTCLVTANSVTAANGLGGGIANSHGGLVVLTDSTVSGNTVSSSNGWGGGLYNTGASQYQVNFSTISGNSAAGGGGAYNAGTGSLDFDSSTISGNTAAGSGGGVSNASTGTITVQDSTLARNTAIVSGGGVYNAAAGLVQMGNTILGENTAPDGPDAWGNLVSLGYNLIGDDADCLYTLNLGDLINQDPLLEDLGDYSGPTLTHTLKTGSPAVDSGDDDNCPALDQRGLARPTDGNGDGLARCDMGSVELMAYALQITREGSGSGTVTSAPDGIDCGTDCLNGFRQNTSVTLTAAPAAGSAFDGWSGDCAGVAPCVLTMTTDYNVTATFTRQQYTITSAAGAGGAISPLGAVTVNGGADKTFTITPDWGFHITDVLVDGSSVGPVYLYTFSSVMANHTIQATFTPDLPDKFTINALAGTGGTITPSGNVTVNDGADQAFTITPSSGYLVADVLVDGSSVGAVRTYTFTAVAANHTIRAVFVRTPRTITASAGAGGTITPQGLVSVAYGASQAFTMATNWGYAIDDVLVDGVSVGAVHTYTFTNVTANHTIAVSFTVTPSDIYTINAQAGSGGTITPWGNVSVTAGADQAFAVTPSPGYQVADLLVDGVSQGALDTYTFTSVAANHTIRPTFTVPPHTITAGAGAGGNISPSGAVSVIHNGSQTFTITPDTGNYIDDVLVDGASVGALHEYTFAGVDRNHTIEVSFAANTPGTYTINAQAEEGGTISPAGNVVVASGGSQAFTLTPDEGCVITDVVVNGVSLGARGSYTFTAVSANQTIRAVFAAASFTITATAGGGGAISPEGDVAVGHGGSQTFTITPNDGRDIDHVLVDGVSVGAVASYTFPYVIADHTIRAVFSGGGGGGVTKTGSGGGCFIVSLEE